MEQKKRGYTRIEYPVLYHHRVSREQLEQLRAVADKLGLSQADASRTALALGLRLMSAPETAVTLV